MIFQHCENRHFHILSHILHLTKSWSNLHENFIMDASLDTEVRYKWWTWLVIPIRTPVRNCEFATEEACVLRVLLCWIINIFCSHHPRRRAVDHHIGQINRRSVSVTNLLVVARPTFTYQTMTAPDWELQTNPIHFSGHLFKKRHFIRLDLFFAFYRAAWNADAVLQWEFCLCVRLSVKRVHYDKTKERYV